VFEIARAGIILVESESGTGTSQLPEDLFGDGNALRNNFYA